MRSKSVWFATFAYAPRAKDLHYVWSYQGVVRNQAELRRLVRARIRIADEKLRRVWNGSMEINDECICVEVREELPQ